MIRFYHQIVPDNPVKGNEIVWSLVNIFNFDKQLLEMGESHKNSLVQAKADQITSLIHAGAMNDL